MCSRHGDGIIRLTGTDRTDQGCALVVLAVNGTAAGQDQEAFFRTDYLCDPEARQGFTVNGSINVGVQFPTQQAPGNHFLQGPLGQVKLKN